MTPPLHVSAPATASELSALSVRAAALGEWVAEVRHLLEAQAPKHRTRLLEVEHVSGLDTFLRLAAELVATAGPLRDDVLAALALHPLPLLRLLVVLAPDTPAATRQGLIQDSRSVAVQVGHMAPGGHPAIVEALRAHPEVARAALIRSEVSVAIPADTFLEFVEQAMANGWPVRDSLNSLMVTRAIAAGDPRVIALVEARLRALTASPDAAPQGHVWGILDLLGPTSRLSPEVCRLSLLLVDGDRLWPYIERHADWIRPQLRETLGTLLRHPERAVRVEATARLGTLVMAGRQAAATRAGDAGPEVAPAGAPVPDPIQAEPPPPPRPVGPPAAGDSPVVIPSGDAIPFPGPSDSLPRVLARTEAAAETRVGPAPTPPPAPARRWRFGF